MTLTSMNPRASALSPHALSMLHPLLRSTAFWHRDRHREWPVDPVTEFDDIDVEAPDPSIRDLSNAHYLRLLNKPYSSSPAASSMSAREIADSIAHGIDPYATSPDKSATPFLNQPPIASMIIAAQFAALFTSEGVLSEVTAARAFSVIAIPDATSRQTFYDHIDNVLSRLRDLSGKNDTKWRQFQTLLYLVAKHPDGKNYSSDEAKYAAKIEASVRDGDKVLALVPDDTSFDKTTRAMCGRVLKLPALSGEMIVEILRTTHSMTGQVAEEILYELLPPDADIAALPLAVIEGAFLEATTLRVAKALAEAARRLRTPTAAVSLIDIALPASTRSQLDQLVADVEAWKAGQIEWSDISSSILLHGPPGNGKTLLASALAGSVNARLVATSYSDCQRHGHQGDMLRTLSAKVDEATKGGSAVFFVDELDSFTERNRPNRSSDYIVGVVNGLLEHLTRLNDTPGVIVLGATNHPDMIDPAVIRPGRFDQKIALQNPDRKGILDILRLHLKEATDLSLHLITDQLLGASGAQVAAVVRDARGLARASRKPLNQRHLQTAADRVCPALNPDILWRIAVHEAGHLVVAHALGLPKPQRAVLQNTGGFVDVPTPLLESRQSAFDRITALMAGRAAEQVVLGEALNGAGLGENSDLAMATRLAAQARYQWGLEDRLVFSAASFTDVDPACLEIMERTLQEADRQAHMILGKNRSAVTRTAKVLLEKRELSGEEIDRVLSGDLPQS